MLFDQSGLSDDCGKVDPAHCQGNRDNQSNHDADYEEEYVTAYIAGMRQVKTPAGSKCGATSAADGAVDNGPVEGADGECAHFGEPADEIDESIDDSAVDESDEVREYFHKRNDDDVEQAVEAHFVVKPPVDLFKAGDGCDAAGDSEPGSVDQVCEEDGDHPTEAVK